MKGRVLVVDDDAALAEMLGIVLRGEGFEPSFVSDGDKALEAFRETRPDLVLLDLMLPGRGRHRRLPPDPGRVRCADRHADRQERHRRRGARTGVRRRRLHRQAVQAQGAGRPGPRPAAPHRRARAGDAADRRHHHRRGRPLGQARRGDRSTSPRSSSTCWSRSPASRARSSPARSCSSRSGATGTPPTPGWSTCTCSGSAPRSRRIPSTPRSW